MHRNILPTLAAAVAVVLAGCGGEDEVAEAGSEPRHVLTVRFGLDDLGATCATGGTGGYDDIGPGLPITVRDEAGEVIGSGALTDEGEDRTTPNGAQAGCFWTVPIEVPDDREFYVVEGGRRGEVSFPRADLEANDWTAELGL